ncbi:hypothetical protein BDV38DRAFT_287898 [Aspergillus pseudotamarii]|uniref:Uncharacterized protein n=1 Tax=Aspergillus pseudotamarii TaxID=132259 RepID=A0A5N6SGU7_ASPPS|nr:uncharacterized protein BDV38DRAFT_287898 [Aspergillus pseudotamarii]KAE8132324.1 hypothetical protein BDV38DRAFT_287898 [Aspergillus pseudotamarii]
MIVREWLEEQHHERLLIVDDADEASLFTSEGNIKRGKLGTARQAHKHLSTLGYLPDCSHGSIAITTRDRGTGVKFTKSCAHNLIEVVPMTKAESAYLTKSSATAKCPEDSEVDKLAKLLEHLPLAIVQAMPFIQEISLMVGEYIELYNDSDETRRDLLCEPFETIIKDGFEKKAVQAMDILARAFPDTNGENRSMCGAYLPHAQSALRYIPELHEEGLKKRRLYLQEGISYYLWSQGRCNETEQLDLLILEEKKQCFGRDHPETLESMASLASTYQVQGRWSEAEALDMYIVETRKMLLAPRHSVTLISMANLASVYEYLGRLQEAETLRMEVLEEKVNFR